MTRPHISCICLEHGVWAALTAHGPTAPRMIARFREAHSGPGHLLEEPAKRDFYGRHGAFLRHLEALRRPSGDPPGALPAP